jgi:predicted ATP-grasp superfamily ATP-dependent carboligase
MGSGPRECLLLVDQNWGSALSAARQLGSRGVRVYMANAGLGGHILKASRYCHDAADFGADDPLRYCRDVRTWAEQEMSLDSPVPVIPLSDRLVEQLGRGAHQFSSSFRLAVPANAVISRLIAKDSSLKVAERAGLHVPAWSTVASEEEIDQVSRLRLPVIVRPQSWATAGEQYFKLAVLHDRTSLKAFVLAVLRRGAAVIAQEYVVAPEGSVEFGLVWRESAGGRTLVCTGRKLRQSTRSGGVMAWGETVDLPEVRRLTSQFVEASGFEGVGGAEFIRADGQCWFIEFNPRAEAIHFLADKAGLPLLWFLHQDLIGEPIPPAEQQERVAGWVGAAWLERLRRHPADLRLYARDRRAFMHYGFRVTPVWSMTDPLPSLHLTARMAGAAVRSARPRRGARGTP